MNGKLHLSRFTQYTHYGRNGRISGTLFTNVKIIKLHDTKIFWKKLIIKNETLLHHMVKFCKKQWN